MPDYAAEFTKAVDELADLEVQREKLERRIARQKRKVAALAELCDDSEDAPQLADLNLGGLTEACRTAMRGSKIEWMTIAEIQQALLDLGFPLKDYKAPAASITTTVNRLVEAGEAKVERRQPGLSVYRYVGPLMSADGLRGVAAAAMHIQALSERLRGQK
jgi:chromosome segregation ATPase